MNSIILPTTRQQADRLRLAISIQEAAQALGIGKTLCFRLIKDGELRVTNIYGKKVVMVSEIEKYLARLQEAEAPIESAGPDLLSAMPFWDFEAKNNRS